MKKLCPKLCVPLQDLALSDTFLHSVIPRTVILYIFLDRPILVKSFRTLYRRIPSAVLPFTQTTQRSSLVHIMHLNLSRLNLFLMISSKAYTKFELCLCNSRNRLVHFRSISQRLLKKVCKVPSFCFGDVCHPRE